MQETFNLSGSALRDAGIQRAIDHANSIDNSWSDRALEMLRCYLLLVGGQFQAEDIRAFAKTRGLNDAAHSRAWGGVIVRAKNLGLIRFVGYKNVSNPKAHATPAAIWTAA